MEHLFMAFQQAMDFDAAGTPSLGRVASYREEAAEREAEMANIESKKDSAAASESFEDTLSEGNKQDDDGILPLVSPDQEALPTCTVNWGGRESFSSVGEASHFFPAEVASEESDESDKSDDSDDSDDSEASDMATIFKSSDFLARYDTSETGGNGHGTTLFSPRRSEGLLAMSYRPASPRQVLLKPKASNAMLGRAPPRAVRKMAMVIIGTVATLLVGMFVGVSDLHTTSLRAPATVVTVYGLPNVEPAAKPTVDALSSNQKIRPSGRTAAHSSIATVKNMNMQYPESLTFVRKAFEPAMIAGMLPALIEPGEEKYVARRRKVRMQRGWAAVAAAAVDIEGEETEDEKWEEAPVRGVRDKSSFGNIPAFPAMKLGNHCPEDCLSQARDRFIRKRNDFFSSLLDGPWI